MPRRHDASTCFPYRLVSIRSNSTRRGRDQHDWYQRGEETRWVAVQNNSLFIGLFLFRSFILYSPLYLNLGRMGSFTIELPYRIVHLKLFDLLLVLGPIFLLVVSPLKLCEPWMFQEFLGGKSTARILHQQMCYQVFR